MISSFCAHGGCVTVDLVGDQIQVGSTHDADVLLFSVLEWDAFLFGVLAGEFGLAALRAEAAS